MQVLVGARGFEPPTPCAQGRCATRLRYAPESADDTRPADRRQFATEVRRSAGRHDVASAARWPPQTANARGDCSRAGVASVFARRAGRAGDRPRHAPLCHRARRQRATANGRRSGRQHRQADAQRRAIGQPSGADPRQACRRRHGAAQRQRGDTDRCVQAARLSWPALAVRSRDAGSQARKVLPRPTSESTSSWPWCRISTCLTIASPSPVPPVSRERLRSTR